MKAIIISDLHMHKWQYGSRLTEQGYNSRLWYLYQALMEVCKYLDQNKTDAVFITGDIFHTHEKLDVQVLFLTSIAFMEIAKRTKLYLLEGNHDMATADGKIHALKQFETLATVIDKPMTFEVAGTPILAHPYTKDVNALQEFLARAEESSVALLHQGVAGANLGSSWVPDETFGLQMIPSQIEKVYCGHFHTPQAIDKIYIPGSIAPHTRADRGARGYLIHNEDSVLFQTLSTPQFIAHEFTPKLFETDQTHVAGHFIRITDCPHDIDVKALRDLFLDAGAESIEVVHNDISMQTPKGSDVKTGDFSIEPLLQEYEKIQMPARRQEIGKLIRDFRYEVPTL